MPKTDSLDMIQVVPYSHHDHAWTNTRSWHIWRYLEGFCLSLDMMRENPRYTMAVDNVLHSLEAFERYCPSRVAEFAARVREGRINVVNGGMALVRPADNDGELLIRNGAEGKRELTRRFGLADMPVYLNADTACGTSQMPQLLRLMGHKYYRFMRPEETLRRMGVPYQFVWRGLDGSEITVGRGEYGGCLFCEWDQMDGQSWPARRDAFVREELAGKLDCAVTDQLMLNVGQDDCLPLTNIRDRRYRLNELMREWNENEPSRMRYSTFDRFFAAISERELPVWTGPLDECELSFNAPFRVDASLRKMRIVSERLLLVAERLDAIACSMGVSGREVEIHALWRRLFDFSGHAMQHLLREDYEKALDGASATVALLRELKDVLTDEIACRAGALGRVGSVVINPTLTDGERVVEMHLTTPHHIDGLRLTDARGKELAWQLVDTFNGDKPYDRQFNEVRVVTRLRVPPMGYASVGVMCDGRKMTPPERVPAPDGTVIDNGVFRATVRGGLIARVDTERGAIAESPLTVLRFLETEPTGTWTFNWKAKRTDEWIVKRATLTENGPLRWRLVSEGSVGVSGVRLIQTIEAGSPVIDCRLTVDNQAGEGYYTLSLPCADKPDLRVCVPFGEETRSPDACLYAPVDDPTSPLAFERGWPYAFYASGYASFRAGAGRLAVLSGDLSGMLRCAPGEGAVTQLLYRSVDPSARTDDWTAHMGEDVSGRGAQHFAFGVAVLDSRHDAQTIQSLMQAQRAPLLAQPRYTPEPGVASPDGALFDGAISGGVQLTAAYRSGDHLIVRLYESAGTGGEAFLPMPKGYARAECVDFLGEPTGKTLAAREGGTAFTLRAWEIVTLRYAK